MRYARTAHIKSTLMIQAAQKLEDGVGGELHGLQYVQRFQNPFPLPAALGQLRKNSAG